MKLKIITLITALTMSGCSNIYFEKEPIKPTHADLVVRSNVKNHIVRFHRANNVNFKEFSKSHSVPEGRVNLIASCDVVKLDGNHNPVFTAKSKFKFGFIAQAGKEYVFKPSLETDFDADLNETQVDAECYISVYTRNKSGQLKVYSNVNILAFPRAR